MTTRKLVENNIGNGFSWGNDRYEIIGFSQDPSAYKRRTYPVVAKLTNRKGVRPIHHFTKEAAKHALRKVK